jgi:hypothetical protein
MNLMLISMDTENRMRIKHKLVKLYSFLLDKYKVSMQNNLLGRRIM